MPKLTLRDLFAVVTIVALALGWWLDRSRLAEEAKHLRSSVIFLADEMFSQHKYLVEINDDGTVRFEVGDPREGRTGFTAP